MTGSHAAQMDGIRMLLEDGYSPADIRDLGIYSRRAIEDAFADEIARMILDAVDEDYIAKTVVGVYLDGKGNEYGDG